MRDRNHNILKEDKWIALITQSKGSGECGLKSNRGSALMLVMISIAFIGILAVVLLGISYTNLRLKTLDGRSRVNYYSAETAIAEIQGVLEEYSADALKGAYEAQLESFIELTSAERTAYLKSFFFTTMKTKLQHPSAPGKYNTAKLKTFTTNPGVTIIDYSSDISSKGALVYNEADATLSLKNVRVEYEENGLKSSITTDIVISLPDNRTEAIGYLDYALISDELIDINTNVTVDVKGGVYAGDKKDGSKNGIVVGSDVGTGDSSCLRINGTGSNLISRSNVQIYNKSSVVVNNATLWAKNIVLGSTTEFKLTQATGADLAISGDVEQKGPEITVDGKTNIKGDLYLNARYSKAKFSDSYFGYSFGGAEGAVSNSAIVINGYGSSLDMSGINVLFIAGRSFVSGEKATEGAGSTTAASDILEGESIATKKNETIYLVDSKYLVSEIGSNPTSRETLDSVLTTPHPAYGSKLFTDQIIKMTEVSGSPGTYQYAGGFQAIYENYLDPNMPIKCYFTLNPSVVYFYLNFKDEEKAQEYVKYYYNNSENKSMFNNNLNAFLNNNKIKINAAGARYDVVGAVIANFNNDSQVSFKQVPNLYSNAQLNEEVTEIDRTYLSLQTYLRKFGGYDEARFNNGYVASVINIPNIHAENNANGTNYFTLNGPNNTCIYLVDNDEPGDAPFIVNESTKHGIVVATGDVKLGALSSATPYKGLIMAVGKIYTDGGAAEEYCEADSEMLMELFEFVGKNELDKYFREYPGQVSVTMDYSKYISYENWVKDGDR